MKDFETKLTDNFIENLKEDINGNIIAEIKENESVYSTNLNFIYKHSHNAEKNVVDRNQAHTIVEFASAFDMCRPIDLDARIKYNKKLHTLYGTNYIHEIPKLMTIGKITT